MTQIATPPGVRDVCERLQTNGHEAVIVGGCVRDALLGRVAKDWDVATSARPADVMALFPTVIPTGIAHGTVTVMTGRGDARVGIEVTTFRGDGAYSDGRRPDSVNLGVSLVEDLARRDLIVNAIAYDPIAGRLHDPFGGADDLRARRLRAVGDARQRFTEDGLRILRVVRFAATLEFEIDPATQAALNPALPSLAKVARERMYDEMNKLLGARQPSRGLAVAWDVGALALVADEVAATWQDPVARAQGLARIDAAPPDVRWPAFWVDGVSRDVEAGRSKALVEAAAARLKLPGDTKRVCGALVPFVRTHCADDLALRQTLAAVGRALGPALCSLWRAEAVASGQAQLTTQAVRTESLLAQRTPLAIADLAIGGNDLAQQLGLEAGPRVGQVLRALLDHVLAHPEDNRADRLVSLAREIC